MLVSSEHRLCVIYKTQGEGGLRWRERWQREATVAGVGVSVPGCVNKEWEAFVGR